MDIGPDDGATSSPEVDLPPAREIATQAEGDVVSALLAVNTALEEELKSLQIKISSSLFRVDAIPDDVHMRAVSGFSRNIFHTVFSFLCLNNCTKYVNNLSPINQFFLFLVYLRTGVSQNFLSILFQIHQTTVSKIINHQSHIIFSKLKSVDIWPSRESVNKSMPLILKRFPKCRVIIDCTEFPIQQPSSPLLQQQTFSHYKNTNTLKALIGITPSGAISFISDLWGGSISDKSLNLNYWKN